MIRPASRRSISRSRRCSFSLLPSR
jgi:hypothetical protein